MTTEKSVAESIEKISIGAAPLSDKLDEKSNQQNEVDSELVQEEELSVTDGGKALLAPVDVKTGEEDEVACYREKAKIFRFDEGENKWKERGAGEARILQDKKDKALFRFILRRNGTGKLGANHYLMKGMKLVPSGSNEKSWVWKCPADSSDEEVQPELFLLRFSTKELAQEFRKAFEECV
eukprot:CAMPEP_0201523006 /NCGR_PEP_ID=MMETSP0161_2-20130828/18691_1 /ASSEMBLY_ACC=CAM_ASM_000251 /TAXON_ID=180227 /ORGANISM="Neoparamoeba aestuarina, Strain SoJaBio B1-5/56/2" /LENGTH=180 /DNA_ID=CAMNT_0047921995 /DNA_START=23 /DNA_END=562 /DNA_ORIENTATION=+